MHKDQRLEIKLTTGELEAWRRRATKSGLTLSAYVRATMNLSPELPKHVCDIIRAA